MCKTKIQLMIQVVVGSRLLILIEDNRNTKMLVNIDLINKYKDNKQMNVYC